MRSGGDAISDSSGSEVVNRNYLLREVTREFDAGRLENRCVIVFPSGAYHFRRSTRVVKEIKTVVIDGILAQDAVRSLRTIMAADSLKGLPVEKSPAGHFIAGTLTSLWIPRETTTQEIAVWRFIYLTRSGVGGTSLPQMLDHNSAAIKPLKEWFKTILAKEHEVPVKDPANPDCLPQAQ